MSTDDEGPTGAQYAGQSREKFRLCGLFVVREDEVSGPVEFLASHASSGMTGHNLIYDGGWSVW